ncbi:GNAT family N-acetyltransferase [Jeotgalibacillus sp. ET6]|uniref:GNAT family N-acetyltransferase n=1 Tax=Jeotgalibacillus sp. ET6 TaxID=3037260 RepID=UPI0024183416|nr:GNAT family N-acetyltransferase [Jeotgalibacillus sp. ET6]MDG5473492.1 GNAT family N-acetyltransferase [Jeotgalibacillus sp. ET6]
MTPEINLPVGITEVPDLREAVGWGRRDQDYPLLLERCNFWAGIRNETGLLIGFGYVAGTGLEHGYLEDVMIHPHYHQRGLGGKLVSTLLNEAGKHGIEIVTVTFASKHTSFYEHNGFVLCDGGIWRKGV